MGVKVVVKENPVEMQLLEGMRRSLATVNKSGCRVAAVCQDTLDPELEKYNNKVARYLGESKREELLDPQKREAFSCRMLNLCDFFGLIPRILDSLMASLDLRKRAVEALAGAYLDAFFEGLFAFLDSFKIVKKGKVDPDQAKNIKAKHFAEIETQQIKHGITNLAGKLRNRMKELTDAVSSYATKIAETKSLIQRLEDSIDDWRSAFKGWLAEGKAIPQGRIERCFKQSEQSFQLKIRKNSQEALQAQAKIEADALAQLEDRLGKLSEENGSSLAEKWGSLLGPDGEGAELLAKAQQECKDELRKISETMDGEIRAAENLIQDLKQIETSGLGGLSRENYKKLLGAALDDGPIKAANLEKYVEEMKQLRIDLLRDEKYQVTLLDMGKNAASTLCQKVDQAQEFAAEHTRLTESASLWDRWWNWLDSVKNYVWEKLQQYVVSVIAAIGSIMVTIVVGIVGFIVSVLMWVMQKLASMTENCEYWTRTYIGETYRLDGQKLAVQYGLPETYFSCAAQAAMLKDMIARTDPDNVSAAVTNQSGKAAEKAAVKSATDSENKAQHSSNKNAVFSLVMKLCRQSLEPDRVDDLVKDVCRVQAGNSDKIHRHVVEAMKSYQSQFDNGDKGFFEFAGQMWSDLWGNLDFSWPQIANYLNVLGSHVTLALRIASAGALLTGFGIPLALVLFAFCEIFDKIMVGLRTAISFFGTVPCANSFAHDLMAILALSYCAMIEENTKLPDPEASMSIGGSSLAHR